MKIKHIRLQQGMSFLEILVVIIIIGLLAVMVGPRVWQILERAKENTTRQTIKTLKGALDLYKSDVGSYPNDLKDLIEAPVSAKDWKGPYIESKTVPLDGWKGEFVYKPVAAKTGAGQGPAKISKYTLYSNGKDDSDEKNRIE